MATDTSVIAALSELGRIEHERIAEEARTEVRSAADAQLRAVEQRATRELDDKLREQAARLQAAHDKALTALRERLDMARAELAVARATEAAQREGLASVMREAPAPTPSPALGARMLATVAASVLLATVAATFVTRLLPAPIATRAPETAVLPASVPEAPPAAAAPAATTAATDAAASETAPAKSWTTREPLRPAQAAHPLSSGTPSTSERDSHRIAPNHRQPDRRNSDPERDPGNDPLTGIDDCGDDPTCGALVR